MSRIQFSKVPLVVLALGVCAGTLQATATIQANPGAIALTCDTVLGPTTLPVAVSLVSAGTATLVTVTSAVTTAANGNAPVTAVTLPAAANTGTNFNFTMAAGCKNAAAGSSTISIIFTPASGTGFTVTATLTVTATGTALAPSPSAVTLLCTKSGPVNAPVYTPGSAQTVNVTSPANLGTPFTVNTTNQTVNSVVETVLPSWLTVTGGGTATATAIPLTVTPIGSAGVGCGALPLGATTFAVHLLNPPAPDKTINVTVEVGVAATTTLAPTSTALSYVKGSEVFNAGTPNVITSTPASYFTVDYTTVPLWLNVTPATGTAPTSGSSVTLTCTPTAGADTLGLGSYTANVHIKISGEVDTVLPVTLQVKDPAATLTVAEGITRTINWVWGTTLPLLSITPISSDSAIAYAITTSAGTASPQVVATSGIAYSFGSSPIPVTFLQSIFGGSSPGQTLSGTVTFTPSNNAITPVTVTINIVVGSPGAVITSVAPTIVPTATSGSFTVTLTGSGFVYTGGANLVTKAGLVSTGSIVYDSLVTPTVVNSNTITILIQAPAAGVDPYLANLAAGGTLTFGVCNPAGSNCSTPASQMNLTVGINPIVQTITSASSYIQAAAPALTPVSAYDILSVFGSNFCVSGGTGCLPSGSNPILYGATDPANPSALHYLTSLTPDSSGSIRNLSVTFQTHASTPVAIANAPLLFATNNQINMVVPSGVSAYVGSTVDVVVNFGANGSLSHSAPYSLTIAATDPGVFTVAGDGQGAAAALLPNYSLITSTNPAGARTGTDSDIISIYVTGLGVPDSTTGATAWTASSTECMTAASYWVAVNSADGPSPALTSNDGLVIQSALFPAGNIQPCMMHNGTDVPSVTIGGITAPVQFAGWVSGSVAGLYQINAQVPIRTSNFIDASGNTAPTTTATLTLPVVVTANGISSQPAGVNVYVAGSLKLAVSGPVTSGHTGNGATWGTGGTNTNSSVVASDGVGAETYTYTLNGADTTALAAIGLALSSTGQVTGTATAGTATVTVNAVGGTSGITGTLVVTYTIT